jgi:pimeloyl-ACP methyl ester carboxylesterase
MAAPSPGVLARRGEPERGRATRSRYGEPMGGLATSDVVHRESVASRRVPVGDGWASYVDVGTGRTVVFLHGWGAGHHAYRRSVRRLASTGVRVLAPALPGFSGTTALPAARASLRGYADWVVAFLDALDLDESVVVVGHSFGGGVAITAAHEHPARVSGLVLVNSIGGGAWTGEGELIRPMAERPLWDWGLHLARDFRTPAQLSRVLPVVIGAVVPNLVAEPRAFIRSARLARDADLTGELEVLRRRGLPVVVVWGRRDGVVTDASFRALCSALGNPDPITVAGGHNWLLVDPDRFGEVMTNVVGVARRARWLGPVGPLRRAWRRVSRHRRR